MQFISLNGDVYFRLNHTLHSIDHIDEIYVNLVSSHADIYNKDF